MHEELIEKIANHMKFEVFEKRENDNDLYNGHCSYPDSYYCLDYKLMNIRISDGYKETPELEKYLIDKLKGFKDIFLIKKFFRGANPLQKVICYYIATKNHPSYDKWIKLNENSDEYKLLIIDAYKAC